MLAVRHISHRLGGIRNCVSTRLVQLPKNAVLCPSLSRCYHLSSRRYVLPSAARPAAATQPLFGSRGPKLSQEDLERLAELQKIRKENSHSVLVNSSGFEYHVSYEDFGREHSNNGTVLAIHGEPGSSIDYQYLIDGMTSLGVRLIVINFPGNGHSYKLGKFVTQTPSTRGEFLSDFLTALEIDRVDVLLSHSAGNWPGLIFASRDDRVKSQASFCPTGIWPHKSFQRQKEIKLISILLTIPGVNYLLKKFITSQFAKAGFVIENGDTLVNTVSYYDTVDFVKLKEAAKKIYDRNIPILYVYNKKDWMVDWRVSRDACVASGVPCDNIIECNEICQPADDADRDRDFLVGNVYKKGMRVTRGGHYVHRAYPAIMIAELAKLLENVKRYH